MHRWPRDVLRHLFQFVDGHSLRHLLHTHREGLAGPLTSWLRLTEVVVHVVVEDHHPTQHLLFFATYAPSHARIQEDLWPCIRGTHQGPWCWVSEETLQAHRRAFVGGPPREEPCPFPYLKDHVVWSSLMGTVTVRSSSSSTR